MSSFRVFLQRFSKKEKRKKNPRLREISNRKVNVIVYGCLTLFVSIGLIGSLRVIGLSNQVETLKNKVIEMNSKEVKESANEVLDISKVQYYIANFIYMYINYDKEKAEERKEKLQEYYAFDLGVYTDDMVTNRTLKSQRIVSIEEHSDYDLAIVKVGYEINSESAMFNLAIPFVVKNGLLTIVSPPYRVADNLYQGEGKALEQKQSSDLIKLSSVEIDSIKEFLAIFFDKYASSDIVDLNLVMKQPVLMGVGYQVDRIEDSTALFYEGEEGKKVVQVSVVFKDKNNNKHTENFTLQLSQSENGWYVDEFYNYFKN